MIEITPLQILAFVWRNICNENGRASQAKPLFCTKQNEDVQQWPTTNNVQVWLETTHVFALLLGNLTRCGRSCHFRVCVMSHLQIMRSISNFPSNTHTKTNTFKSLDIIFHHPLCSFTVPPFLFGSGRGLGPAVRSADLDLKRKAFKCTTWKPVQKLWKISSLSVLSYAIITLWMVYFKHFHLFIVMNTDTK